MVALSLAAYTGGICQTTACMQASISVKNDVDFNVDPCSDFYQYTCGSWLDRNVIPENESGVGTFSDLRSKNIDILRSIIEGNYEDLHFGGEFVESDLDRDLFETIQDYYHSCMNETEINRLGVTPIFPLISELQSLPWQQGLVQLTRKGVEALVSWFSGADDHDSEWNVLWMTQPRLGMPSKEYFEQTEHVSAYRKAMNKVMQRVLAAPSPGAKDSYSKLRVKESKKHNLQLLPTSEVTAMVDRVVHFETRLANITLKQEDMQNPLVLYNRMSVRHVTERYPVLDWHAFISNFTDTPSAVIVSAPEYLANLRELIEDTDEAILQEFLTVKAVMANAGLLDSSTRKIVRGMQGKITSGTTTLPSRAKTCVQKVGNTFGHLMARYFMMSHPHAGSLSSINTVMKRVHKAWLDRLALLDWLDPKTREQAINKVNMIQSKSLFSSVSPDVRSPESLQAFLSGLKVQKHEFYKNELSSAEWGVRKEWSKVGQRVDRKEWFMNAQDVNAYYSPSFNEIVVPAGILQSPFFDPELPDYLNYGGIGVVIGHEFTHAFDNAGRLYDGVGQLRPWWMNATADRFNEKSQCFIDQYSNFTVEDAKHHQYHVNGKMTLGENLADNGGISAAWTALMENQIDMPRLPDLDLSPEALFFVNFGRIWCRKERPQTVIQKIHTDVHSPARVRVNAAARNSPEFAKVFQCPSGSPMNPVKKCKVW